MPYYNNWNDLNLMFGPKLPQELETLGIAFIAAPNLRPDSAIGALSAVRYARENYDHRETGLTIYQEGEAGKTLDLSFAIPAIAAFSNPQSLGLFNSTLSMVMDGSDYSFPVLDSAVKVAGVNISMAGTWCPLIQPGVVWRYPYTVTTSGIEPSGSWLRTAFDTSKDHVLILVYAVPEYAYGPTSSGGLTFPPSPSVYKQMRETVVVVDPNKLGYEGDIDILTKVTVNGTVKFTGSYTGVESSTYLKGIDKLTKRIGLLSSLAPDDEVTIEYLSYNQFYIYSGFRDASGNWWPFDANPEYGHVIGDDQSQTLRLSSDALLKQVTLYAIPTAAIEVSYTPNTDPYSSSLGSLALTCKRAIDYGETHFVRHIISSEPTELIDARDGNTVINTWGYATFGRNYYDEQNTTGGDIFNTTVPSMIPLGRFVLGAPAAEGSVSVADIRQRGGGVPLDFPMVAVDSQESGLDKLRGFLELGIWESKAIKEGGVVEIQIDKSLLKTDENDTDPTKFLATEIEEIVKKNISPGIDFEIKYVENL